MSEEVRLAITGALMVTIIVLGFSSCEMYTQNRRAQVKIEALKAKHSPLAIRCVLYGECGGVNTSQQ